MASHWFERYREAYRKWWQETAEGLDDEEREDFDEFKDPDSLTPLGADALNTLKTAFPHLQPEVRAFLSQFGAGDINFPDHHGDNCPAGYRIFDLEEIEERVASIKAQAEFELEQLDDGIECDAHGDDHDQCRALLTAVRDHPRRFYPFLGPDGEHNFVYILQGVPREGVVSNWYHDYPVCELLDGSADTADFAAFGEELIANAESGDRRPL